MKMRAITIAATVAGITASNLAFAERWVETVGSAPIVSNATGMAREYAVRDALRQAMLQTKAYINSTSVSSNNALVIESASLNTAGKVDGVEVLREWTEDDFFYVRIRAKVDDTLDNAPSPAARYRKRVALLQLDVLHRQQISDVPGIETSIPKELLRRIENTDNFVGIDATQAMINDKESSDAAIAQRVIALAEQSGAQIVVAGTIRDMSILSGLVFDDRAIELELSIFDGISGVRISRQRFSERVPYTGYQKTGTSAVSHNFFTTTRFGKALDHILDSQAALLEKELKAIPFSARIINIQGQDIIFDAGASARIEVGDTLMAYRVDVDPYRNSQKQVLGFKETPVAALSVTQVQPQFAVGKLEIAGKLYAGDIIRFGY
jgi:hypothetical protein